MGVIRITANFFTAPEWKKKRSELIGAKTACAWCGSKEGLAVCRTNNPDAEIMPFTTFRFEEFTSKYNKDKPAEPGISEFVSRLEVESDEKAVISKEIQELLAQNESKAIWDFSWNDIAKILKCKRAHAVAVRKALRELLKEKSKENWQAFSEDTIVQQKLAKEYEAYAKPKIERYKKCLSEDIIILCRRCNFARMNGLELCPVCKKKYKGKRYPTCFGCKPDGEKKGLPDAA